eukprot:TRINITY_DN7529_c0_g1_i1.p1 TRINITY_DN7529_c0_g1~~TRINITY_DN7529_c0_g1_i1.p1  ORF type:complete len:375 (+),score=85.07 TRINITY_DN7529_c0_g1_i1:253-1377(+)
MACAIDSEDEIASALIHQVDCGGSRKQSCPSTIDEGSISNVYSGAAVASDNHGEREERSIMKSEDGAVTLDERAASESKGSETMALLPSSVSPSALSSSSSSSFASEKQIGECRICQEEDDVSNLEQPCACSGTLEFAHRSCVQKWCNEKRNTVCEICHQPYKSGYTAPRPRSEGGESLQQTITFRFRDEMFRTYTAEGTFWRDTPSEQEQRQLLQALANQQGEGLPHEHLIEVDYEDPQTSSWGKSIVLIVLVVLLIRHALFMMAAAADEQDPSMFTLFALPVAGVLLPCFVMGRALGVLQRRREQREATMAAAEVALLLEQARRARISNLRALPPAAASVLVEDEAISTPPAETSALSAASALLPPITIQVV